MLQDQITLAIETSFKKGSLSLLIGNEEKVSWVGDDSGSRSEDLLLAIQGLFRKSGIKLSQLDLVAVSNGPGSFTGLRVGIAIAQGIAFSQGIKCVGVSVLEAMAYSGLSNIRSEEIMVIVSLANKFACWQGFRSGNDRLKKSAEMMVDNLEDLNFGREKEKSISVAVENETYQMIVNNHLIGPWSEVIKTPDNLAKFVGLMAQKRSEIQIENKVLPRYSL